MIAAHIRFKSLLYNAHNRDSRVAGANVLVTFIDQFIRVIETHLLSRVVQSLMQTKHLMGTGLLIVPSLACMFARQISDH